MRSRDSINIKLVSLIIVIIFMASAYLYDELMVDHHTSVSQACEVIFADVGQGDCILVKLGNGETMLIDSGEYEYREDVRNCLEDNNVTKIDYLIATHPHSDHIGSMSYIIDNFDIGMFYMPECVNNSQAFEKMLRSIRDNGVETSYGKCGDVIFDTEFGRCEILSPTSDEYDSLNDYSIVTKLEVGSKSFLFMGDAEKTAEKMITSDVDADVLKLGHHGSSTSTSEEFFDKVSPEYAVVSCGKDNEYGHPHREVEMLIKENGVELYRTDKNGDIRFVCDGDSIVVEN